METKQNLTEGTCSTCLENGFADSCDCKPMETKICKGVNENDRRKFE